MSIKATNAIISAVSVDHLREAVDYDPETGDFVWRHRPENHFRDRPQRSDHLAARWNGKYAGKPAFTCSDPRGYKKGMLNQKMIWAHRAAVALHLGEWPSEEVDHINRDKTDNRLSNLRPVSHQENAMNRVQGGGRGPRT